MLRPSRAKEGQKDTKSNNSNNLSVKNKNSKQKPTGLLYPVLGIVLLIFALVSIVENLPSENSETSAPGEKNVTPASNKQVVEPAHRDTEPKNADPAEDGPPLLDIDGTRLHLVFSTDCSEFQHWQSYLIFHSALSVKQPGHVTRIASGCTDEQKEVEEKWHNEHIRNTMSDRFTVHFTPHFSAVKKEDGSVKGDYKFFNKPFGLRHWMEHGEGMGIDETTEEPLDGDLVIILTDPDMILLRPIGADFTDKRETITKDKDELNFPHRVTHGHPIAQKYGLGAQWRTFKLATITGTDSSPAMEVSMDDGNKHYPAGPPYLATGSDMYKIALKWTEFVPKVHAEYPYLLAEMFAYCIAAAHLKLPHLMVESLMVSNTQAGGEGWPLVDAMEGSICEMAMNPEQYDYARPGVVHFCQRYMVGDSFFAKRRMPKISGKGFFECNTPLLVEPPMDLGEAYPFKNTGAEKKGLSPKVAKREAFMICAITKALNDAGKFFKEKSCNKGNLNKNLKLRPI